jgi:hypothetical protein
MSECDPISPSAHERETRALESNVERTPIPRWAIIMLVLIGLATLLWNYMILKSLIVTATGVLPSTIFEAPPAQDSRRPIDARSGPRLAQHDRLDSGGV